MKRITLLIALVLAVVCGAQAKRMSDLKIYINPGHGGYTSNDRGIKIYPYPQNDTLGYWESKSNLYKGLHMYHILDSLGAKAYLSRIKNTEDDDRSLSGIAAEANQLGVDLFFSIHSNAGENVNYPLMLYREQTIGTPRYPENVTLSKILWKNLHSSQLPVWSHNGERVSGDLTFYQNMWSGGLGVLRTLYVVGLLSEGSMHEHRPEAHRLMNDDYWWLEAWHFVKSIMEFYDTEDKFVTGNVAGVVYDNHNLRMIEPNNTHLGRDKNDPVNGAFVELLDANGTQVQTRTTDNDYNGVFVFRNVKPGQYKVRVSDGRYYTEEKDVTVVANEVTYQDMPLTLRRETPLEITAYSPNVAPGELVSCASSVDFTFNTDVDEKSFEEAFSITPAIDGYFKFSDSYHKVSFIPTLSLDPDVTYTVRVAESAKTPDTHYAHPNLNAPLEFSFTTRNRSRLEMIDQFPANGGTVHYVAPTIEFRFDNTIDASNLYDIVTIRDSKGNSVGINKRSCKFNQLSNNYGNAILAVSGNLQVGETYNITLSGELRDKEQLPMQNAATIQFTATDESVEHGGTVMDDFEGSQPAFAYNAEYTKGIGTTLPTCIRSTTYKLFGAASSRMSYVFTDNHDGEIVWDYKGEPHQYLTNDIAGIYINGDFNNHELYLGFTSGTDTKYAKVADLNFLGWQYREVKLDMLEENFTYVFSNIKLVQTTSPITQKGAFSVDNLTYKEGEHEGIDDVISDNDSNIDIDIVGDFVYARTAATPANMCIYNIQGQAVASVNNSSAISIADLAKGIYLVKVNTADGKCIVNRIAIK